MRRSKFSKKQIIEILKKIKNSTPVIETLQAKGISKDTYYKWKHKYSNIKTGDIKRIRELEKKNAKLKKLYTEIALINDTLKDVIEKKL